MHTDDKLPTSPRPSRYVPLAMIATILAVLFTFSSAPAARADSAATIDFPGRLSCEVTADNPHASANPVGDISGKINVTCRQWNSSERGIADRIDVDSELSFYPGGVLLFGETVKRCSGGKGLRYSYGLPCHGPWQGAGRYSIDGTVTITLGNEVQSAGVGKGGYVAGGVSGPVA